MDEDRVALVFVRGRLRQLGIKGGAGFLADRQEILHLRQDDHAVAAGDHLGRAQQAADDRGRQAGLFHDFPDASLGGLLEGPAGHRRRLGDDGQDVLRRLQVDGADLQFTPRTRLRDPSGLSCEHASGADAQGGDESKAK